MKRNALRESIKEALKAVLPIAFIVAALCFTIAPVTPDIFMAFTVGSAMLVLGLGFFTFGAENSMTRMGNLIGTQLTSSRNHALILGASFLLGVIITIAEPDLQVLASNVPHIDSWMLIITISIGVGFFLALCMQRILRGYPLRFVLLASYALVFLVALFEDPEFLSVAFDSGGVTTGPMTSPLIMALGVGVASIRTDRNAEADSFGLIALCSIGPILAVLILGFFYPAEAGQISAAEALRFGTTGDIANYYLQVLPHYIYECTLSLGPVLAFFLIFNAVSLRLKRRSLLKILAGVLFAYAGLVMFLTGANAGFSSVGLILGNTIISGERWYAALPVAAIIGWFIVDAEPAVHILAEQVEEISNGAVSSRAMKLSLSVAVSIAAVLAIARSLFGLPILWFLIPGYAFALILAFVVPPVFTAIAFDSGGVASGPMATTFMLPLAMGACIAAGGDPLTDAFGAVALIALMPLITVQGVGLITMMRSGEEPSVPVEAYDDDEIIELWGVAP